MCNIVINSCSNAGQAVWDSVKAAATTIGQAPGKACRKFESYTNEKFPGIASALQKTIYGLPVTIAGFYMPWVVLVPTIVALAIIHISLDKNPLGNYSYQVLFRGAGNIGITNAIMHTVTFVQTSAGVGSGNLVLAIAINLIWAKGWNLAERLLARDAAIDKSVNFLSESAETLG